MKLDRAAWGRIKARLQPAQRVAGKLYAGDITSISIGGREFPVLEFASGHRIEPSGKRSGPLFKGRSVGATVGVLETFREQAGVVDHNKWRSEPSDPIADIRAAAEKMRADHLRGPRPMSPDERARYEALGERLVDAIPRGSEKEGAE